MRIATVKASREIRLQKRLDSLNPHPARSVRVLYLTTSLEMGGAQMMLYKLLASMDRTRFEPQVISLIRIGPMGEKIESLGVPVRSLGMRPGIPNPMALLKLIRWIRQISPDVIQTWMYHADLIGGLAAKLAGRIPVAWGIRQSNLSDRGNRRLTIHTMRMCALVSSWVPARIVCVSEAARRVHAASGYAAEKMIVIPNGFDLDAFKPNATARAMVRTELQIPSDAPLIGLVGRFDPQKDHHNFICAAAFLHRSRPDVYFLLCGDNVTWENAELRTWIDQAGIREQCRLLGRRHDLSSLTAALDVACSSSFGEGFPNVIGEAMACGVPCVVTDVGDSAFLVGHTGRIVPPQNPKAMANALCEIVELERERRTRLGIAARSRVQKHFDVADIVSRYQNLYHELAGGPRLS